MFLKVTERRFFITFLCTVVVHVVALPPFEYPGEASWKAVARNDVPSVSTTTIVEQTMTITTLCSTDSAFQTSLSSQSTSDRSVESGSLPTIISETSLLPSTALESSLAVSSISTSISLESGTEIESTSLASSSSVTPSGFPGSLLTSLSSSPNVAWLNSTALPGPVSASPILSQSSQSTAYTTSPFPITSPSINSFTPAVPTQTLSASISVVISAGSTASYTPTQIPSEASLTATLITTATDAYGTPVGIIIYPTSGGWGWQYPCVFGCVGEPYPPAPPAPPAELSSLETTVILSGSTGIYTPTQISSDSSLTSTLITSSTDAAGNPFGLIIYPSSGGRGWQFPCELGGCTTGPFIPPAGPPPQATDILSSSSWSSGYLSSVETLVSTMTTAPPGFSIQSSSNSVWTGNTWITTEAAGISTIVPVIVGCNNCGGEHGGIILWNLPEIPNISFDIPGFPTLPKIHLPCIKIFGIQIGDCQPETDEDRSKNDSTSTDSSETTKPTSTEAFSTTTPSSSRSTSESCTKTQTVSDCSVICTATPQSPGVNKPITTQPCSTTCFSAITGCSPTGTTVITTTSSSRAYCGASHCPGCTQSPSLSSEVAIVSTATCDGCLQGTGFAMIAQSTTTLEAGSSLPTGIETLQKRTLSEPSDYDSFEDFFVNQLNGDNGKRTAPYQLKAKPADAPGLLSYALRIPLLNTPYEAAVWSVWGCTVVIVQSQKGAWLGHFWEDNSFRNDQDIFDRDVLDAMAEGDGTQWMPGIEQDTGPQGLFSPETNPKAIIITPGDRATQTPEYLDKVELIQAKIGMLIPSMAPLKSEVVVYDVGSEEDASNDEKSSGKVLFQYDPAQIVVDELPFDQTPCKTQAAAVRVWMGGINVPLLTDTWIVKNPSQMLPNAKRDTSSEGYCPISSSSMASSTQSIAATHLPSSTVLATSQSLPPSSSSTSSSSSASETLGSLFCAASSGPGTVDTGIPQAVLASNITDYCSKMAKSSSELGCNNQTSYGGTIRVTSDPVQFDYSDVSVTLNVSLINGDYFSFTEDACNQALAAVMNGCPPFSTTDDQELMKYGGGIPFIGPGGIASFNVSLSHNVPQQGVSTSTQTFPATTAISTTMITVTPILPTSQITTVTSSTSQIDTTTPQTETTSTLWPFTATDTPIAIPYETGICNAHILEASESSNSPLNAFVNITDGGGRVLHYDWYTETWGDTITIDTTLTNLPDAITILFSKVAGSNTKNRVKRLGGNNIPPAVAYEWQNWLVDLSIGNLQWNSGDTDSDSLPYCNVGGWDDGNFGDFLNEILSLGLDSKTPNRQMDCHWTC